MKKLIQVLRDRRGESMVEILVSTVVFMLLLGALNGAVGFASNAQRKAEQLREDAVVLQREVRAGTPAGDDDASYDFRAATPDGTPNSRYAAPCARALTQSSAMSTSGTSRSLPLTVLRTKCTIGMAMVMKA